MKKSGLLLLVLLLSLPSFATEASSRVGSGLVEMAEYIIILILLLAGATAVLIFSVLNIFLRHKVIAIITYILTLISLLGTWSEGSKKLLSRDISDPLSIMYFSLFILSLASLLVLFWFDGIPLLQKVWRKAWKISEGK